MDRIAADDQAETIAFLMRPESHGDTAHTPERIDTHGAVIVMAGGLAYKLKRAVLLPYLDFSTIDKRRAVCDRELLLNRRTAPSLYREVLAIRRKAAGGLRFGGDGEVVDWVIVMQRFPQEALLDRLCTAGTLDTGLMAPLAEAIARFHANAEKAPDAQWLPTLHRIIATLDETLLGRDAAPLALDACPAIATLRAELAYREPLLRKRQRDGFVRHCHGDLHLKNIVLLGGGPVLFDALEFDDNLTNIDLLYDLAFLLMDLWHRGKAAEANAVLNGYCDRDMPANAWDGLALLPLFLALRAAIRAMVGVHGLEFVASGSRADAEQGIRKYAALASDLLKPRPPMLVCVGGLSGTGKTTTARGLAPDVGAAPGAIHLRSDVERKRIAGCEPTARLEPSAYTEAAGRAVYASLFAKALPILRAGHCVIIDAVFRHPAHRDAAEQLAREASAAFLGLWLDADAGQMIARVTQRRGDASDAGHDVVLRQLQSGDARPAHWTSIDARDDADATLARARAVFLNKR